MADAGPRPIRLLIADDHTLFRQGIRALLASVADIELVGEASGGEEAVMQAAELRPDVILLDIRMPDLNGIEATRRILRADPAARVVLLTMLDDNDSMVSAIRAGARGYVIKGADESEMLRVIRAAAAGELLFGPSVAERMLSFMGGTSAAPQPFSELTDREREILRLVAQGRSNAEIASQLFLSPKTVRNYISSIFDKLNVTDRSQAIIRAREAGMGH